MAESHFITPDWPVPENIRAFSTCRSGGFSQAPYDSFNLAKHVGDKASDVERNRQLLPQHKNIVWLTQTHSNICLAADQFEWKEKNQPEADASFTQQKLRVCAVMTADCLPVLMCDEFGTIVAAVHAGWRGLANGILENTINKMAVKPANIIAWMGPAISQTHFEVGPEVMAAFQCFPQAFLKNERSLEEKYFANLYYIATKKLNLCGVERVFGGDYCTYSNDELFFSHRKTTHLNLKNPTKKGLTGRMLSAIYIT